MTNQVGVFKHQHILAVRVRMEVQQLTNDIAVSATNFATVS